MPRGDRTGPWGAGPKTGRAAGYCAGYTIPGFMNPTPGYGRGFGRGWGRGRRGGLGRGWGRGFGRGLGFIPPQYPIQHQQTLPPPINPQIYTRYPYIPQSAEQEIKTLENYKTELQAERADLEQELGQVESRIEELKTSIKQEEKTQPEP